MHNFLKLLKVCAIQFIGNTDSFGKIPMHNDLSNNLPMVLDSVTEEMFGKYSIAADELSSISNRGSLKLYTGTYQFSLCSVSGAGTIMLTQWALQNVTKLRGETVRFNLVLTVLSTMGMFMENPQYLFIEHKDNDLHESHLLQRIEYLRASITSHIFFVTQNSMALLVPRGSQTYLLKFVPFNLIQQGRLVVSILRYIEADKIGFSGRRISLCDSIKSAENVHRRMTDCSLLKDSWSKFANGCALITLGNYLNFTYPSVTDTDRRRPPFPSPRLWYNAHLSSKFIHDIIRTRHTRLEILPHAFSIDNYHMYVFTNNKLSNLRGLVSAFDMYTWILLLLCTYFTVLMLRFLCNVQFSKSLWWIFRTLISQPYCKDLFFRQQNFPLIFGWFILGILLGQLYQGNVFSCLLAVVFSEAPSSIQQVLNSKTPIIEISRYRDNGQLMSGLKASQIRQFKESCFVTGTQVPNWISKLESSIHFSGYLGHRTINSILAENYSFMEDDTNNLDIFAVMDSIQAADEFADLMREFLPEYKVQFLQEMYPFNYKAVWVFERNMLLPRFQRFLSGIFQSGLYSYWQKHSKLFFHHFWLNAVYTDLYIGHNSTYERLRAPIGQSFKFASNGLKNLYAYTRIKKELRNSDLQIPQKEFPVPLSALSSVFFAYSTALGLTFSLLLKEVCWK